MNELNYFQNETLRLHLRWIYTVFMMASLLSACKVTAATYNVLYTFASITNDLVGADPEGSLAQGADGTLYGTTFSADTTNIAGIVFKVQPDGTGFSILKSFTNSLDGANPTSLVLSGNTLYGTAFNGGSGGSGTIFKLNTDGSGFAVVHAFSALNYVYLINGDLAGTNSDGANPQARLILSGSTLYGAALNGGKVGAGTAFKVETGGTGFQNLHSFLRGLDGATPVMREGFVLSGNRLFGTTLFSGSVPGNSFLSPVVLNGGSSGTYYTGYGTLFAIGTDGSGYTNFYHFQGTNTQDDTYPLCGLVLSGTTLFGTTSSKYIPNLGDFRGGEAFSIQTDGTRFTNLHTFDNLNPTPDGLVPYAGLILSGNMLYGTTSQGFGTDPSGTAYSSGTVFAMNTNGSNYAILPANGYPHAGVILSGNFLYGTTTLGFFGHPSTRSGSVFGISVNGAASALLQGSVYSPILYFGQNVYADKGSVPKGNLVLSGNTLYGTASYGGLGGAGTVFSVSTGGSNAITLHSFAAPPQYSNTDGTSPAAGLILSSNILYGTASSGGDYGYGTVFGVKTNGESFTTLHTFAQPGQSGTNTDGALPVGGLLPFGPTLYGMASAGGPSGGGVVFNMNDDGTGFSALDFGVGGSAGGCVFVGNRLYGTSSYGGDGYGTVFAINTNGTGLAILHNFSDMVGYDPESGYQTNLDGINPEGTMLLSDGSLYGATSGGGTGGSGTLFKINTDGTGFAVIHTFGPVNYDYTNSDGSDGMLAMVEGSTLYGTMLGGGPGGSGTIFAVHTDGTGFTNLYIFSPTSFDGINSADENSDGARPQCGLTLSGNTFYGSTSSGGVTGEGVIFALTLAAVPIPLNIQSISNAVVLRWTDSASAYSLQTAPSVTGVFTNVPWAASPYTNFTSGSQKFFRLQAN